VSDGDAGPRTTRSSSDAARDPVASARGVLCAYQSDKKPRAEATGYGPAARSCHDRSAVRRSPANQHSRVCRGWVTDSAAPGGGVRLPAAGPMSASRCCRRGSRRASDTNHHRAATTSRRQCQGGDGRLAIWQSGRSAPRRRPAPRTAEAWAVPERRRKAPRTTTPTGPPPELRIDEPWRYQPRGLARRRPRDAHRADQRSRGCKSAGEAASQSWWRPA